MKQYLKDIWLVLSIELRRVFGDKMVLLIFFIAPIIYPLIFCCIYHNENVENMPVAVVDAAPGTDSKRFIRKLDATPELDVAYRCSTLDEARQLFDNHKARAIFYFPDDFSTRLAAKQTARVVVYGDMSSFYYYKAALTGGNNVLIDEMHTIELQRYADDGLTGEEAYAQLQPVVTETVTAYNPSGGYGSFFLPCIFVLVLHQTLFLGICILYGEANENRYALHLVPPHLRRRSVNRVMLGRSICYILIYFPLVILDLWLIPRWFNLPQLGNLYDILLFALPFILAVIYFGIAIGTLVVRQKISPMLCFVFFSLAIFFLTGMVWPHESMPAFWRVFSQLIPSTPGVQGFVKITSMGATLAEVRSEYMLLWFQAAFYFIAACLVTYWNNHKRQVRKKRLHTHRNSLAPMPAQQND